MHMTEKKNKWVWTKEMKKGTSARLHTAAILLLIADNEWITGTYYLLTESEVTSQTKAEWDFPVMTEWTRSISY